MQKVVGSNPIIRFARNPLQTRRFPRSAGATWPTRWRPKAGSRQVRPEVVAPCGTGVCRFRSPAVGGRLDELGLEGASPPL